MRTVSLNLLIGLCVSACSSWPQSGPGGGEAGGIIAEPTYLSAVQTQSHAGLLAQSEVLDAHVELLIVQGAQRCIPAAVVQLQQQGLALRRELAAHLLADAADDLAVYQHLIRQVRQRFDAVRRHTQCAASAAQLVASAAAPVQSLSLFTLLFDHNSAEIGPGYQRHLQLVAELLQQCDCQLTVVGHTDQQGSVDANQQLAQRRVSAVQQALQTLGVHAAVEIAAGEQEPLLQAEQKQALNRRVELWIKPRQQGAANSAAALLLRQWQDAGVLPAGQ